MPAGVATSPAILGSPQYSCMLPPHPCLDFTPRGAEQGTGLTPSPCVAHQSCPDPIIGAAFPSSSRPRSVSFPGLRPFFRGRRASLEDRSVPLALFCPSSHSSGMRVPGPSGGGTAEDSNVGPLPQGQGEHFPSTPRIPVSRALSPLGAHFLGLCHHLPTVSHRLVPFLHILGGRANLTSKSAVLKPLGLRTPSHFLNY